MAKRHVRPESFTGARLDEGATSRTSVEKAAGCYGTAPYSQAWPSGREQRLELVRDQGVTLARRTFQSFSVDNGHQPAAISNQSGVLERVRHDRDTRAAHAKHRGEKLVRKEKLVGANPIVRHQQPL